MGVRDGQENLNNIRLGLMDMQTHLNLADQHFEEALASAGAAVDLAQGPIATFLVDSTTQDCQNGIDTLNDVVITHRHSVIEHMNRSEIDLMRYRNEHADTALRAADTFDSQDEDHTRFLELLQGVINGVEEKFFITETSVKAAEVACTSLISGEDALSGIVASIGAILSKIDGYNSEEL